LQQKNAPKRQIFAAKGSMVEKAENRNLTGPAKFFWRAANF